MMRVLCVLALVASGVITTAQAVVHGTRGQGIAIAHNAGTLTDAFTFNFEVTKATFGDLTRVRGTFTFETAFSRASNRQYAILTREIEDLQVNGKQAGFYGPAILRTRGTRGMLFITGHVRVVVEDNRSLSNPDPSARPDMLRVQFIADNGQVLVEHELAVLRGDIVVRGG